MAKRQMVINYVPGEECRVAIVDDGRLEDFHAERMDTASHVGNIYVGKVVNVEQGIQAAFVDFGLEANGFLHVSDVHPQYFPGSDEETTERVGKKTPRRDRPPIQHCFRRGDEVIVQVLKEGVGTKGPTVTSYLSIPGRFLVMMPNMDRVGVSRKVEDEDARRKMREILDQLDLPEGFGFILRTAGMERNKTELKRDLAYLQRLWKDMERRRKSGNKPRLLYSESDLLVRALRDMLTSDIEQVVVDNEAAIARASRFLKIISPRSSTKLVHYKGKAPIYHVTGIEDQIQMIHAREVPLPSGGRLVIDETEALVAIDVNSGKMRDAKDAETTAYRTNIEATDEICRQLRLRDLGGVVVNDLIDMRFSKHRRDIENRFKENLKKDRARWTIAPISEFGVLEMTRQRMRGSHESQHFAGCPVCHGRGLVQRPDSVAADGLRELAAILDAERVARVEMVVNPRIAGELLSLKRKSLSRIERTSGKRVDVRVSDAIAVDRVGFYAYDERGADIDTSRLSRRKVREDELVEMEISAPGDDWSVDPDQEAKALDAAEPHEPDAEAAEAEPHPIEIEPDGAEPTVGSFADDGETAGGRGRRRRRRGRGRSGAAGDRDGAPPRDGGRQPQARGGRAEPRRASGDADRANGAPRAPKAAPPRTPVASDDFGSDEPFTTRADDQRPGAVIDGETQPASDAPGDTGPDGERRGRRRRRRRRGGRGGGEGAAAGQASGAPGDAPGSAPEDSAASEDDLGSDLPTAARRGGSAREDQGADQVDRAPAEGGEPVEGERRGRRRRRRRGRGGRGGEGAPGAAGGGGEGGSADTSQSASDGEAPDRDGSEYAERGNEASFDGDGPSGPGSGPAPGGEGAEGGPRRRRRRRRGRGGDGGPSGSSHGSEGGTHPRPDGRAPADNGAGRESRGGGQSGGGGDRGGRPPQPQRQSPPPAPAPSPAPKPRTLYSSRRRLGPSERRPSAGEE